MPGVRRVWGTFKSTPTGAVIAALKKLTTLGEQLRVKRKFREGTRSDRWWFLLYGEEELLKQLEGQWEKVALQTNWKIESCTKPAASNENESPSDYVSPRQPNAEVSPQPENNPSSIDSTIVLQDVNETEGVTTNSTFLGEGQSTALIT